MSDGFRIEDYTGAFLDELEKKQRLVLRKLGKMAVEEMKSLVPVDDGDLKDSINYKISQSKDKEDFELTVGAMNKPKKMYYAHIVEGGSETARPQPFIAPVASHMLEDFSKLMKEEANKLQNKKLRAKKKNI